MEKILQILTVFVLLMLAITYFVRGREQKFREYVFSGKFTFPLTSDGYRNLLTVRVRPSGWGADDGLILETEGFGEWDDLSAAVDGENQLLFRRGPEKTLEIREKESDLLVRRVELEGEADGILFDQATRLIYCCSVEGVLTVIRQAGPETYRILQRLTGPPACTALSFDPDTGKLYLHNGAVVFVYTNS